MSGLRQEQFAANLSVTRTTINRWETEALSPRP
ncbi:helix-turn-helix transcriptional regulator [Nostoc sp.]